MSLTSVRCLLLLTFLASLQQLVFSECNGNANYLFDKLIVKAKEKVPSDIDLKDYVKDIGERKNGLTFGGKVKGLGNFQRPQNGNGNSCFVLDGSKIRALAKIEISDIFATGFVDYKQKIGELVRKRRWGGFSSVVRAVENAGNNVVAEVRRTPENVAPVVKTVTAEVARIPSNVADITQKVSDEISRTPDNAGDLAKNAWDEVKSTPDNIANLLKNIRVDSSVDFEAKLEYLRLRVGIEADMETKKLRIYDYEVEEVRGFNLKVSRLGGLVYFFEWARGFLNRMIPQQLLVDTGKEELKKALTKAVDEYVFDLPFLG